MSGRLLALAIAAVLTMAASPTEASPATQAVYLIRAARGDRIPRICIIARSGPPCGLPEKQRGRKIRLL